MAAGVQNSPETMDDYEFYIRLEEDSLAFIYTIRRAGDLIETGTVSPTCGGRRSR